MRSATRVTYSTWFPRYVHFVPYQPRVDRRPIAREKFFSRAIGRLSTLGWYGTKCTYRGNHVLYVTRVADRIRWSKLFTSLAAADGGVYSANLYGADGLGYSGRGWYGFVNYPGVDVRGIDKYMQSPSRPSQRHANVSRQWIGENPTMR